MPCRKAENHLQQRVEQRGGGEVAARRETRDDERLGLEAKLGCVRVLPQGRVYRAHLLDLSSGWVGGLSFSPHTAISRDGMSSE